MTAPPDTLSELARAKINLTLHVGPARNDGYHLLDSLVAFADIADKVSYRKAPDFSLKITGPFADGLCANADNLVLKAANLCGQSGAYGLEKNLPIASGIGGGSADGAAVIRMFQTRTGRQTPIDVLPLGADVPVCLLSMTARVRGIGETLTPLPGLGQIAAVLVNPGVQVSTQDIFSRFDAAPSKPKAKSEFKVSTLLQMAQNGQNDLQDIAIKLVPEIDEVLTALNAQAGCQLARMSGSGASCFGLFQSTDDAQTASKSIQNAHKDWWCVATQIGDKT